MRHFNDVKDYTKKTAAGLTLVFMAACGSVSMDNDHKPDVRPVNDNDSHVTTGLRLRTETPAPVDMPRDDWYKPLEGELSGKLLIHKLVEEGNAAGLRRILDEGYDVDAVDDFGRTAARRLVSHWGRLDRREREDMFSALKAHGADFLKPDGFGVRPLITALVSGHEDVRDLLLAEGDDLDTPGRTRFGDPVYPLLKVAASGALSSFRYMVEQGVALDVKDRDGAGVIDNILQEAATYRENLAKLEIINRQPGFDVKNYLEKNPDGLIEAFSVGLGQKDYVVSNASYYHQTRNENLTKLMLFLDDQGVDFNRIVHSRTEETLAHKVAAFNNRPVLRLLEQRGYRHWGSENNHGATATDYAVIYGSNEVERFLRAKNVGSAREEMVKTPLTEAGFTRLLDRYGDENLRVPKDMPPYKIDDFYSPYTPLRQPDYYSGNKPIVAVTGVTMQAQSIEHLDDTLTVVNGTVNRLSGHNSTVRIQGFAANPKNPENLYTSSGLLLSPLLLNGLLENRTSAGTPVIISHSTGYSFDSMKDEKLREIYQEYQVEPYKRKSDYFLGLNPIGHYSNGNNGNGSCAPLDEGYKEETCFRAPDIFRVSARAVHVGAAEQKANGDWVVHNYSDNHPSHCAALPMETDKRLFYGTSFAAPASAGTEAELFRLHGRSDRFPQGVSHEDIMLALHLTTDRNIIDERTGLREEFNENAAGIGMSVRCGAGVIRPERASEVLEQMVRAAESGRAAPTELRNHEIHVDTKRASGTLQDYFGQGKPGYVYEIRVPETGYATKPYVNLNFDQNKKGAAYMVSPRGTATQLRPSLNGHADTDRFLGEKWQEGEVLKVITSKPLKDTGTRAFIRTVAPESAFGYIAGQHQKENPAPVYQDRKEPRRYPVSRPQRGGL